MTLEPNLYDADGQLCADKNLFTGAMTAYIYDASGNRVAKGTLSTFSCNMSTNGFTTTNSYVIGPNGEQLSETDGGETSKCALVRQGQRFSLGQRVMMIRPNQAKVRPTFFLYQLLSPTIQEDHIGSLCKGSASPHLNIGALRRFPFALPNFDVQDCVIAELDALQSKLDLVKTLHAETSAELDAMLPAILDKAFKGELV